MNKDADIFLPTCVEAQLHLLVPLDQLTDVSIDMVISLDSFPHDYQTCLDSVCRGENTTVLNPKSCTPFRYATILSWFPVTLIPLVLRPQVCVPWPFL
jgi:hypothetical protein